MFLYRTKTGIVAGEEGRLRTLKGLDWDHVFLQKDPRGFLLEKAKGIESTAEADPDSLEILPPIKGQEVWAAGVTYRRSREARMEESQDTGGGDFYDRVYAAPRPEFILQKHGAPHGGPRAGSSYPERFRLERSGTGIDPGHFLVGPHLRIHYRERHEFP